MRDEDMAYSDDEGGERGDGGPLDAGAFGADAAVNAKDARCFAWGPDPRNPRLPAVEQRHKALLDVVAGAEGTSDEDAKRYGYASGYDATFGFGRYDPPGREKPLTQMTLDEVDSLRAYHRQSSVSDAMGRYQIKQPKMDEARKALGLTGNELYSPELQDRLGRYLLKRRGYDGYLAGKTDLESLQNGIAHEWSSLPKTSGFSAYPKRDGQLVASKISSQDLQAALKAAYPANGCP